MKKIFILLMAFVITTQVTFAQNTKSKKMKSGTAQDGTRANMDKSAAKPAKMKKDGTPDMRYKDNKNAAKPAGPMKKDGTPDMRHKANKAAGKQ